MNKTIVLEGLAELHCTDFRFSLTIGGQSITEVAETKMGLTARTSIGNHVFEPKTKMVRVTIEELGQADDIHPEPSTNTSR